MKGIVDEVAENVSFESTSGKAYSSEDIANIVEELVEWKDSLKTETMEVELANGTIKRYTILCVSSEESQILDT